jgi:hypothetical protein
MRRGSRGQHKGCKSIEPETGCPVSDTGELARTARAPRALFASKAGSAAVRATRTGHGMPDPESAPESDSGPGFRTPWLRSVAAGRLWQSGNAESWTRNGQLPGLIMDSEARKSARVSGRLARTRAPTFGPHYP